MQVPAGLSQLAAQAKLRQSQQAPEPVPLIYQTPVTQLAILPAGDHGPDHSLQLTVPDIENSHALLDAVYRQLDERPEPLSIPIQGIGTHRLSIPLKSPRFASALTDFGLSPNHVSHSFGRNGYDSRASSLKDRIACLDHLPDIHTDSRRKSKSVVPGSATSKKGMQWEMDIQDEMDWLGLDNDMVDGHARSPNRSLHTSGEWNSAHSQSDLFRFGKLHSRISSLRRDDENPLMAEMASEAKVLRSPAQLPLTLQKPHALSNRGRFPDSFEVESVTSYGDVATFSDDDDEHREYAESVATIEEAADHDKDPWMSFRDSGRSVLASMTYDDGKFSVSPNLSTAWLPAHRLSKRKVSEISIQAEREGHLSGSAPNSASSSVFPSPLHNIKRRALSPSGLQAFHPGVARIPKSPSHNRVMLPGAAQYHPYARRGMSPAGSPTVTHLSGLSAYLGHSARRSIRGRSESPGACSVPSRMESFVTEAVADAEG